MALISLYLSSRPVHVRFMPRQLSVVTRTVSPSRVVSRNEEIRAACVSVVVYARRA